MHLWGYMMDAAPGDLHTGIQGLFDCMQTSENRYLCAVASGIGTSRASIRQERGMDVNDTLGEVFAEGSAEDAHPAGKHTSLGLKYLQDGSKPGFAFCHPAFGRTEF